MASSQWPQDLPWGVTPAPTHPPGFIRPSSVVPALSLAEQVLLKTKAGSYKAKRSEM